MITILKPDQPLYPGASPTLRCTFKDMDGNLYTPSTITGHVRAPNGTLDTNYSLAGGQFVLVSTGIYDMALTLSMPGTYRIKVATNSSVQEFQITVSADVVG